LWTFGNDDFVMNVIGTFHNEFSASVGLSPFEKKRSWLSVTIVCLFSSILSDTCLNEKSK
jgi:hypothetical protein